jgi:hypothetical protein
MVLKTLRLVVFPLKRTRAYFMTTNVFFSNPSFAQETLHQNPSFDGLDLTLSSELVS